MQHEIDSLARDEIDRSQREYYLRQQMKAIRNELGEGTELEEEIEELREKVKNRQLPTTSARRSTASCADSSGCTPTPRRARRSATTWSG